MSPEAAFAVCRALARSHYENFPVASLLIPRDRRPYVAAVYAFARIADDMADEGALAPQERLAQLDAWERQLDACYAGQAEHPVFIALRETARRTGLPRELLADLLRAFRMDVTRSRYATFEDLRGYCAWSANPVGRIVLHLFGDASPHHCAWSDDLCTGLQLANFWQDLAVDRNKGRIYLPLEDMARFGYTEADLGRGVVDDRLRALVRFEVERTRALFQRGAPLAASVTSPLRLELRLTIGGGNMVLDRIVQAEYDTLSRRPVLSAGDKMRLVFRAVSGRFL